MMIDIRTQRVLNTLEKLESFRAFEQGWDLGRGEKISEASIDSAEEIVLFASQQGVWKSSAFPAPSGSVLLAFPISKTWDIEVYADTDGTFDFSCERAGRADIIRTELSLEEACSLVVLYGNEEEVVKCLSESSILSNTTTRKLGDFAVQLLNLPLMEGFRYSMVNAPTTHQGAFAITSKTITDRLPEPQYITGS